MESVGILGLGAMGSRIAIRLLDAGFAVRVWNRSGDKAEALVSRGAVQADTPRDVAKNVACVISMVTDDEASRTVWLDPRDGALAAMAPTALAIESSTLSYDWTLALGRAAQQRGLKLIDCPVAGSRLQAEAGQLIYLVGAPEYLFAEVKPLLLSIGSAALHVGPYGSGMLAKLCTNVSLGVQTAMLADLVSMLVARHIDPAPILSAVAQTPVWSPVATRSLNSMIESRFEPQFPTELMEKDLSYASTLARSATPTITGAAALYRQAVEQGLGQSNFTSIISILRQS